MMPTPVLNSKCAGTYFVNRGENSYVQSVRGMITEASQKVMAEGLGIAFLNSRVIVYTDDGPKTAYILQCCNKVLVEGRPVALMGSTINNCPQLLTCQLIGGYSQKVLTS
jgi:uncharacterized Zn-binding protein involved in type VI secretion